MVPDIRVSLPVPSPDGSNTIRRWSATIFLAPVHPLIHALLIEFTNPGSYASAKSSVLLISLLGVSLPWAWRGIQAVQATSTHVTASGLISSMETPTTFLERLLDHRFAHIVWQRIFEPGKSFDASFKLYTMSAFSARHCTISASEAEFAFLSACHTVDLTEKSIADQALHLAAAMQYCDFAESLTRCGQREMQMGGTWTTDFCRPVFSGRTP